MNSKLQLLLLLVSLVGILFAAAAAYEWFNGLPVDAKAHYVGGAQCIDCHRKQYELFRESHHDRAMDVANNETVLAPFDGREVVHYGVTSRVFKSDGKFMVNTESADGSMKDFEVKYVFGCEPLQQYMVEVKRATNSESIGQLQVLRLSWDVENEQWFYLSPWDVDEKIEPDDPLHWTGITQRWNSSCATCHSTNLQKNYDLVSKTYATTFTDIDVNCEACHGPGSLHVEIANKRRFFWDRNHKYGLVNLKSTSNLPQVETCAPCHSRRAELFANYRPEQPFDDHFACQLLSDGIYHDDGQILEEDYVYGSFIQSKMFHHGIRCSDCHDPHSTKVKFNDNRLCTSCHQHPAGKYDSPSHHRHLPNSTGSLCVECHMPATTYMAIDPRRDHSLRVPRPDLSVKLGTPNACTACHLDKKKLPDAEAHNLDQYLDWLVAAKSGNTVVATELERVNKLMADAFTERYPEAATNPNRSRYYEQLAFGKADSPNAEQTLRSLAQDRSAPAIFRATALESLAETSTDDKKDLAIKSLHDDDPKVVAAALRMIGMQIGSHLNRANYAPSHTDTTTKLRTLLRSIDPLLEHPSRRVRMEAARTIANIPGTWRLRVSGSFNRQTFEHKLDEYLASLRADSDRGEYHAVLGTIYELNNQPDKAESEYRNATAVEPLLTGPRTNIASLLDQRADQLRQRIIRSRNSPDNVSLGKRIDELTAEAQQLRVKENSLLQREVERAGELTEAHDLHYRYGLSCYLLGKPELAEKHLLKAFENYPSGESYVLALATFYNEKSEFAKAISFSTKLLELDKHNTGYQRLHENILQKSFNTK